MSQSQFWFNFTMTCILIAILCIMLAILADSAEGYGGSYNKQTRRINMSGHHGVYEYIFLHEWGHSFWHEEMTWQEKDKFGFRSEYFANVYGASFECKLTPQADERIKTLMWWKR